MPEARSEDRQLKAAPAWEAAGQRLVSALAVQPDEASRIRLLERVLAEFGDQLYPAYIRLLCAIDAFGDTAARAVVADTFAQALSTGRLPTGRMPAWGAAGWSQAPAAAHPGAAAAPRPAPRTRSLGPIEFLCAWLMQPGGHGVLTRNEFAYALERLLHLFDASASAARLYRARLSDESANSLEGAFSRQTRLLLDAIAQRWGEGLPAVRIASDAIAAIEPDGPFGAPAWRPMP